MADRKLRADRTSFAFQRKGGTTDPGLACSLESDHKSLRDA
jgi:hypothetical protein